MPDGSYTVTEARESCGIELSLMPKTGAQSDWHTPTVSNRRLSGWADEAERSLFGIEAAVGARASSARAQRALLVLGERVADACAARANDGYVELHLTFAGDPDQTCLSHADPIPRTIAVHERRSVLTYATGLERRTLRREGQRWVADDAFTVEGEQFDCPGQFAATCTTMYGYRNLRWSLGSITSDGDGELTIVDQVYHSDVECRRVVPFHAVLVAQPVTSRERR
jgi:hypothetical protein